MHRLLLTASATCCFARDARTRTTATDSSNERKFKISPNQPVSSSK